jgi:hypothetical protein
MNQQPQTSQVGRPSGGGPFRFVDLPWWLPACALAGMAVAYVSSVAGSYHTPLIVFPLVVGAGLGAVLVTMLRIGQVGNRPTLIVGLLLAVAVVVPSQHYLSYRTARRTMLDKQQEKIDRAREIFSDMPGTTISSVPETFAEFIQLAASEGRPLLGKVVARGPFAWLSWSVDGLLILAAAGGILILAMRQPYCRKCRSWYRTIRNGRVDGETALRLAECSGVNIPSRPISARYRMLNCNGGCGRTEFELSWEDSSKEEIAPAVWIDGQCRNSLMRILDDTTSSDPTQPEVEEPNIDQ